MRTLAEIRRDRAEQRQWQAWQAAGRPAPQVRPHFTAGRLDWLTPRFRTAERPRPAPAPRHGQPMPGPAATNPDSRTAALMASYARLWQRALVVAERKLRGTVLP